MSFPPWLHAGRLMLTFLVTSAAGIHAYALFKSTRHVTERSAWASGYSRRPIKWSFLLFAAAFLFAAVLNFIYLLVAIAMRSYAAGPFRLGTFSLIVAVSYLIIVFGSGRNRQM